MARETDKQLKARLEKLREEASIQETLFQNDNRRTKAQKESLRLQKEILDIEKELEDIENKRTTSRKATVKIGQADLKINKELERTDSLINKSLSTRITQLMKGNIAGAIGLKSTRAHEKAQRDLAEEHKEQADIIKKSGLDQSKQVEIGRAHV